jgi:hypothetical protein
MADRRDIALLGPSHFPIAPQGFLSAALKARPIFVHGSEHEFGFVVGQHPHFFLTAPTPDEFCQASPLQNDINLAEDPFQPVGLRLKKSCVVESLSTHLCCVEGQ